MNSSLIFLKDSEWVQVPRPTCWQIQAETSQVLRVNVSLVDARLCRENFCARMDKSGRITKPKLTLNLLQNKAAWNLKVSPAAGPHKILS
jgi:hypothetical protein